MDFTIVSRLEVVFFLYHLPDPLTTTQWRQRRVLTCSGRNSPCTRSSQGCRGGRTPVLSLRRNSFCDNLFLKMVLYSTNLYVIPNRLYPECVWSAAEIAALFLNKTWMKRRSAMINSANQIFHYNSVLSCVFGWNKLHSDGCSQDRLNPDLKEDD